MPTGNRPQSFQPTVHRSTTKPTARTRGPQLRQVPPNPMPRDTDLALEAVIKGCDRLPVGVAVMSGDCRVHVQEFNDDGALHDSCILGFGGLTADDAAAAAGIEGRPGKLLVRLGLRLIEDLADAASPISLGRADLPFSRPIGTRCEHSIGRQLRHRRRKGRGRMWGCEHPAPPVTCRESRQPRLDRQVLRDGPRSETAASCSI